MLSRPSSSLFRFRNSTNFVLASRFFQMAIRWSFLPHNIHRNGRLWCMKSTPLILVCVCNSDTSEWYGLPLVRAYNSERAFLGISWAHKLRKENKPEEVCQNCTKVRNLYHIVGSITNESDPISNFQALNLVVAQPIASFLDWASYCSSWLGLESFAPYPAYSKIDLKILGWNISNKIPLQSQCRFLRRLYALSGE